MLGRQQLVCVPQVRVGTAAMDILFDAEPSDDTRHGQRLAGKHQLVQPERPQQVRPACQSLVGNSQVPTYARNEWQSA